MNANLHMERLRQEYDEKVENMMGPHVDLQLSMFFEENRRLNVEVERRLIRLESGAIAVHSNGNYRNSSTPLHLATENGNYDVVESLLRNGGAAHINAQDGLKNTALHLAVISSHNIAALLLKHGADVASRNFLNQTPLHVACQQKGIDAVRVLLENSADINIEVSSVGDSTEPNTPLDFAVQKRFEETVELLLARGARISNSKITSLHLAASVDSVKFCQLLISAGADINAKDLNGSTPLHVAMPFALQFLITQGADVNARNNDGMYPLHTLPYKSWYDESVVTLLAKEVGLNCRDNRGRTPLHIACELNDVRKLTVLLKRGGDVDSQDCNGLTPLSYAHSTDVVPVLLENGTKINAESNSLSSVLDCLREKFEKTFEERNRLRVADTVTFLKHYIKMIKAADMYMSPRLHQDVESLNLDVRKLALILKRGANVDSKNCKLYDAQSIDIVLVFLENCTNIYIRNALSSALDCMREKFEKTIAEGNRQRLADLEMFLKRYIKMMRAVGMHVSPKLLRHVGSLNLDDKCSKELKLLKRTTIGRSEMTYYNFLRQSADILVLQFSYEGLTKGYKVERLQGFGYKFPNFEVLIRQHFNKASSRKILIGRTKLNCSEVFSGLNEDCIDEILKYFSNHELSAFADAFAEITATVD